MVSKIIECDVNKTTKQESISAAMKELSRAGFRLYSYLWSMAELEDGKAVFQLCAEDVCTFTGMGERTYYTAVEDLTDHGYIKPKAGKKRYYLFDGLGGDRYVYGSKSENNRM